VWAVVVPGSVWAARVRPASRGVNGKNSTGLFEIWVSQRASLDADWGPPVNLDAFNSVPVVNSVNSGTAVPSFSADGHLLFFNSNRPGGLGGNDLYVSRRSNKHDDFGWQERVNLGSVNSPQDDNAATYFEDEETGIISLYITSNRSGILRIWVSTLGDDGSFGTPVLVPELSSPSGYEDNTTDIRRDGLELFLVSNRPNGRIGVRDIWVSTRDSTLEPWSTPVNLGPTVNYPGYTTGRPSLSSDGTTLYLYSDRPGIARARPRRENGDAGPCAARKMRSRLAIEAVAAPLHEIPDVRLAVRRRREVHSALVLPQSSLSSDLQGDSHASDHAGPILCGCEGFNSGHSPRPATQSLSQQNRWQIEGQVHGGGGS